MRYMVRVDFGSKDNGALNRFKATSKNRLVKRFGDNYVTINFIDEDSEPEPFQMYFMLGYTDSSGSAFGFIHDCGRFIESNTFHSVYHVSMTDTETGEVLVNYHGGSNGESHHR